MSVDFDKFERNVLNFDELDGDLQDIYTGGTPPVTIKRFIEDDYYMAKIAGDLYPENRPDILDIFAPDKNYVEIILTGATSIGKTFLASLAITYIIYLIGKFRNPHLWLGGSPASPIVIINMSISAEKAKQVVFTRIKTMIDTSPYFREEFRRDYKLGDTLVWNLSKEPDDEKRKMGSILMLKPGTGDSLSALGDDIFSGVGDELNFFRVIEKSKRTHGEALDPAQRLYDVISRRMKGRFSAGGMTLGKFFLLSSAQYPEDFIERRIREAEESGDLGKTIKIIRKSIWEAKGNVFISGKPFFCGKTFRIEVGTVSRGSRIIDTYDKKTGEVVIGTEGNFEGKIINVPIELWDDFYRDIEGSVRDFAGEVTRAISPFFSNADFIYESIDYELRHPWTKEETTLEDGSLLNTKVLFQFNEKDGKQKPIIDPHKFRTIHVDLAKSGDSAGMAVVHISKWVETMDSGKKILQPFFIVDMMLRIVPPMGGEIQFDKVLNIIRMLRNNGMAIGKVTYDSWQSTHSLQILKTEGFNTDELSVDKDVSPYIYLRNCMADKRLKMYNYEPVITELVRLEKKADKVDHPPNGSKDVSDALCGAVWNAFQLDARSSPDIMDARMPVKATKQITQEQTKREIISDFEKWAKGGK